MIFDTQLILSEGQAVTADAISENVINWNAMGAIHSGEALRRDVGDGNPIPFVVQVTEAFDNLTSLEVTLEQADNAALSTNAEELWSYTFVLADLIAGVQVPMKVLPRDVTRDFLGMRYNVTGTAPSTGKITAGVVHGVGTVKNPLA